MNGEARNQLQSFSVYTRNCGTSHLYLNEWDPICDDRQITYLGIEKVTGNTQVPEVRDDGQPSNSYPPSLTLSSRPPYTQYNEPWYYTNCRMDGATTITFCIDTTSPQRPVMGMLVGYGNDRYACLGQYRMDMILRTINVDQAERLRLGIGKSEQNLPYVACICLGRETIPDGDKGTCVCIPWRGKVEWWFSQRQCRIYTYEEVAAA